jgi:hypothetical protein
MYHSRYPSNHRILIKFEFRDKLPLIGKKIRQVTVGGWKLKGVLPSDKLRPSVEYDVHTIANPKIKKRDNTWICQVDKIERKI